MISTLENLVTTTTASSIKSVTQNSSEISINNTIRPTEIQPQTITTS